MARATATSGGAVLFAGSTVVIALVSLLFGGIPIVSALGYSAAIVVAVAVCAALTLLPAILGLLGERIHNARLPVRGHSDDHPHGWARWARGIGRRPALAAIAGTAILVALAIPLLDITLGQPDNSQLPTDTETRQSYDILEAGFGAGTNGPLLVSVKLDPPAKPNTKKLNRIEDKQKKQEQQAQQQYEEQAQQAELAGEPPPPEPAGPTKKQQKQQEQQEKFLKSTASDPRLVKLGNQISKDPDVDSASLPVVNSQGDGGGDQRHLGLLADLGAHRRPRQPAARRDHSRRARLGADHRVRRRFDRLLHRPRRPDRGEAPAGDRDRRRAQLPAADGRLPLDRRAAHGRPDEPGLGRRRLRRPRRGLRGGRGAVADRPRTRDPDRVLRPAA